MRARRDHLRILLLLPDGQIHKLRIGRFERSMREAPLTLTHLAALVPDDVPCELAAVDESVSPVPADQTFDLVAISLLTGTAQRGYRWADHFRRQGARVVVGGVHATLLPDEAAGHADHVIVGPAEESWPTFLRDFLAGRARPRYEAACSDAQVVGWPRARRELQAPGRYNMPYTVAATRGCRHRCSFCTVPRVWKGFARRPVGEVIDEIRACPGRLLAFNDVSLVDDVDYARELFTAMIPLGKRWGGLATVHIGRDPALVELMSRSGCRYLLIGFESVAQGALHGIRKGFNREADYEALMRLLHQQRISVQGCFIFGFDEDQPDVFERTVARVQALKIDIPRFALLTPYPGTPLFRTLEAEGRILTRDWSNYDTMHVVFEPRHMSPEALHAGYKWAYRETFRLRRIGSRIAAPRFASLINLVGNLTYRRFVRRLEQDARHAVPFGDLEGLAAVPPV